ncbi:hypothetical protein V6Z12_D10G172900 [Gossypium hirsutum]
MRMDILLDNRCHMGAFFVLWPLLTHQPDQSLGASDTTEEENPRETEDRLKEFKEKEDTGGKGKSGVQLGEPMCFLSSETWKVW